MEPFYASIPLFFKTSFKTSTRLLRLFGQMHAVPFLLQSSRNVMWQLSVGTGGRVVKRLNFHFWVNVYFK